MWLTLLACSTPAPTAANDPIDVAFEQHADEIDTIAALRDRCATDCGAVLAAATGERPLAQRAVLWWSIAAAETPSGERDAIGEAAAALFVDAQTPESLLWPLGRVMLRSGQEPVLDHQLQHGRVSAQAAAACAVLAGIPAELHDQVPLSDAARAQMGTCAAPWSTAR